VTYRLTLFFVGALMGAPAVSVGAVLPVVVRGEAGLEAMGKVTALAVDGRAAPVKGEFACRAGSACAVDLPIGADRDWLLSVAADGFWATPPSAPAGGTVELWPAGSLNAKLRIEGGSPTDLAVRFSPSPGVKAASGFPKEGTVECPVVEGGVRCQIPAGVLDLRLRAKGHVSVYRWTQRVPGGGVLDLGRLELKRGASLVGTVTSPERDAPKPGACVVRLEPRQGGKSEAAGELPRTTVNARGVFHLEVVPPGTFNLVAEQGGFAAARRSVTIVDGMEANLNEPLVLRRPARLELVFAPPTDPFGKPWMVELLEKKDERFDLAGGAPASLAGFWARDNLGSGNRFSVRVRTSANDLWWSDGEAAEIVGPISKRQIDLGHEEVSGSVRLGELPLAARVIFTERAGNVAVTLRSDAEGRLSGALPRLGAFHVDVASESPSVHRKMDVEVRRKPDGRAEVEIALEDRALIGEIVDETGRRLERAMLTVTSMAKSARETVQERVEGGAFRLTGFEPGGYRVRAEGQGRISEPMKVEIAEDGSSPFVTIVTKPKVTIRLQILTEAGAPVAGATVDAINPGLFPGVSLTRLAADTEGRVSYFAHPSAPHQCFVVNSPGLARLVFAAMPKEEEQGVVLAAAGGTLVVKPGELKEGEARLLWKDACYLSVGLLKSLTRGDGTHFAGLAPGTYRLCRHAVGSGKPADSVCTSGHLDRYGVLELALPSSR
jgi:hypothetical protein